MYVYYIYYIMHEKTMQRVIYYMTGLDYLPL